MNATAPPPYQHRDRLNSARSAALRDALSSQLQGEVRFDAVSCAMHSTDASVYQILPLGVVLPRAADDVVRTVQLCNEYGASITARGGGTSQAGQAIGTGVQLDFSKYMNQLLEVDESEKTVRVQPGIVLDALNARLQPLGLHLPLDLSTSSRATIGGMIANNSAGTRSVVYGKTLDYVLELTVVLADGSIVNLRPLEPHELADKMAQTDLEGDCYRVVRQLASTHEDEIQRRYPRILRRVGGYNLDAFIPSSQPFNLCRLLVGSEGTLGLTVEAKLRLAPLPTTRVVCAVQFDDLLEAMAATPLILAHRPSAIELIDRFILDTTRGKTEFEPLRDFIVGDPGAVLIVEFFGDEKYIDAMAAALQAEKMGHHIHRAIEPAAQTRIWDLRKAALGLSMSQIGDAKSISFVEDTAVAPEHLHDYIARFLQVLEKYATPAGFYAHASVGLLHIRPVVNMKKAEGIHKFESIAAEIAALELEYGGALSGEHGDGLVRAPFQQKMFGPVLYEAFCQLKKAFDPDFVLNPGKIVYAPPLAANLRFGTAYSTRQLETGFDFDDFGGISRAAEQCSGVGACRKNLKGTMCPSYMATRDEAASTRGRANALRLAISGQLGSAGLTDPALYPILDLCLECKACKSECPTGVDMARLKSEFLYQYHRKHGAPLRDRCLGGVEKFVRWGSRLAPALNFFARNRSGRWLGEQLLGLDRRRQLPPLARPTFLQWWAQNHQPEDPSRPPVALFADTFTNYHEPEHPRAVARLAARLGHQVVVPARVCCGRPLISKGFLDQARQQAEATSRILLPLAARGVPILFCEPSCYSAVRDDHPQLLRGAGKEAATRVAAACTTFEEWAGKALGEKPAFCAPPKKIFLHGHCHQKALVGMQPTLQLFDAIPDCQTNLLDSGCCGMAGSFGYECEHYEISRTVGEHRLFPALRQIDPESLVVAPGFSCRHQIRHFTGIEATSPMVLLETLLTAKK